MNTYRGKFSQLNKTLLSTSSWWKQKYWTQKIPLRHTKFSYHKTYVIVLMKTIIKIIIKYTYNSILYYTLKKNICHKQTNYGIAMDMHNTLCFIHSRELNKLLLTSFSMCSNYLRFSYNKFY